MGRAKIETVDRPNEQSPRHKMDTTQPKDTTDEIKAKMGAIRARVAARKAEAAVTPDGPQTEMERKHVFGWLLEIEGRGTQEMVLAEDNLMRNFKFTEKKAKQYADEYMDNYEEVYEKYGKK